MDIIASIAKWAVVILGGLIAWRETDDSPRRYPLLLLEADLEGADRYSLKELKSCYLNSGR